ncbi:DUF2231 domain-containing protein [Sphingomonas morindae]|uniref:DUF2231 domain-containing protein n=1 Tax=Sphingomonas morindae TaxID=1541170 RepID=A0ABY4XDP3_9SPHN|nr:DUF2231 domain-containing protein [Sphingomonas morindae]USI75038.1 DUF2231 domain-containing protein [Sphingomonas morindae]
MARPAAAGYIARPVHPFFVSLGGTLLMAAFFTDYMYASNALMQWANFSAWLITGGLVLALVATIILLVELALRRTGPIRWLDFALLAVAALLSIANVFIHTRDAWTSVVPSGITLSAITAILLLIAGLRGWRVTADPVITRGDY